MNPYRIIRKRRHHIAYVLLASLTLLFTLHILHSLFDTSVVVGSLVDQMEQQIQHVANTSNESKDHVNEYQKQHSNGRFDQWIHVLFVTNSTRNSQIDSFLYKFYVQPKDLYIYLKNSLVRLSVRMDN